MDNHNHNTNPLELITADVLRCLYEFEMNHVLFVAHYPSLQWYCMSHSLLGFCSAGWDSQSEGYNVRERQTSVYRWMCFQLVL